MNKQEVKSSIKDLPCFDYSKLYVGGPTLVNLYQVLALVDKMDEPQKVVVPKFVAEWIESNNEIDGITYMLNLPIAPSRIVAWIDSDRNNARILARAWLDGYTIEREKLYTVEIPNSKEYPIILVKDLVAEDIYMIPKLHIKMGPEDYGSLNNHLTESEIRQDFEWAWQAGFAKEVE